MQRIVAVIAVISISIIAMSGCIEKQRVETNIETGNDNNWEVLDTSDHSKLSRMGVDKGTLYKTEYYGRATSMVFVPN